MSQSDTELDRALRQGGTIYLVDGSPPSLHPIQNLAESAGLRVRPFMTANAFLAAYVPDPNGACVVLEMQLADLNGLEVQERLLELAHSLPVIFVTSCDDIPTAVRAMKLGAYEYLAKPVDDTMLLDRICDALSSDRERIAHDEELHEAQRRFQSLSRREREILELVVAGLSSVKIADRLKIRKKTVESHRLKIMKKTAARNVVKLIQLNHLVQQSAQRMSRMRGPMR